jgi:hypothetical protein
VSIELSIKDARSDVLDYALLAKEKVSPLREFFQFWHYPRTFSNPTELSSVKFYDVHITQYISDWPSQPGPPDPAVFAELFPKILAHLVGDSNVLTLHVKGVDRTYFDELDIIDRILVPRNLVYVLLPPSQHFKENSPVRMGAGNLIFEWPGEFFQEIPRQWFHSPCIELEGYISARTPLGQIAQLYFEPDTELRIRKLLREVEIGFKVWQDNNGLLLLTDKFGVDAMRGRLEATGLSVHLQ